MRLLNICSSNLRKNQSSEVVPHPGSASQASPSFVLELTHATFSKTSFTGSCVCRAPVGAGSSAVTVTRCVPENTGLCLCETLGRYRAPPSGGNETSARLQLFSYSSLHAARDAVGPACRESHCMIRTVCPLVSHSWTNWTTLPE